MTTAELSDAQDHLLVLDPSKRFTAEDALRHPFLLSVNAAAEKVLPRLPVAYNHNLTIVNLTSYKHWGCTSFRKTLVGKP